MAIVFGLKYPIPMELQALCSIDEEGVVIKKIQKGALEKAYDWLQKEKELDRKLSWQEYYEVLKASGNVRRALKEDSKFNRWYKTQKGLK